MKNALPVSESQLINAPLLFFIVNACQIGVGIHGFQRLIYQDAKQDAWISILISFVFAHFLVFIMIKTLEMFPSNDLYGIHEEMFGKLIGNIFNCIYIFYYSFAFLVIIKNYIEVINVWVFPNLSSTFLGASLLIVVIYAFNGGFRVIAGICFFSFIFTLWVPSILFIPMKYSDINQLLPVFDNQIKDILKGAYSMTFTIIGFEIINVVYPYVKEKNKVQKYTHLSLLATLILYLAIMLITLTYFSGPQLEKTIWATLNLFSIIKFPFIERVEIITICLWMVIILPNLCLFAWSAHRGVIRMFNISAKKFIWIFSTIILIFMLFIKSRTQINAINNIFSQFGFIIVFVYPLFIYLIALIKKSLFKRKRTN